MSLKNPLFHLHLGPFIFHPSLIPSAVTLLVVCCLLSLGNWQLNRAQDKQTLLTTLENNQKIAPLSLQKIEQLTEDVTGYPITIDGFFDNNHTLLVDNQLHKGIAGYFVYTPFKTINGHWVLINRGWFPAERERSRLPNIPSIENKQRLEGFIHIPTKNVFISTDDDFSHVTWPARIQAINMPTIRTATNHALKDYVIRLNADDNDTTSKYSPFIRQWQPVNMSPQKHYGYAFQWFCMALVLTIIYITVNTHRRSDAQ